MYWPENGEETFLKKGEALLLRYRVLVHGGNTTDAKIGELFELYKKQNWFVRFLNCLKSVWEPEPGTNMWKLACYNLSLNLAVPNFSIRDKRSIRQIFLSGKIQDEHLI